MTELASNVSTVVGHQGLKIVIETFDGDPNELRPLVLMLHGGGQNRHAWSNSAKSLQRSGHTVVTVDSRGHGDSEWDPTGNYDTDDFTHDLLALRSHISPDRRVVAIGASMGGMSLLNAHRLGSPALWAGVVLVDVTPRMEIEGALRVVTFMSAHADGFASLEQASVTLASYNPHRAKPKSLDGLRKVLRERDDGRFVWLWDPAFITSKADAMAANPGSSEQRFEQIAIQLLEGARRITAPTLLIRGAMSDLVSPETVKEFLTATPHATSVDVSNTGHMLAGDDNDAFTLAVKTFLNDMTQGETPASGEESNT
jgi:pimeloyl-ACP methyl ester carboxylesterase